MTEPTEKDRERAEFFVRAMESGLYDPERSLPMDVQLGEILSVVRQEGREEGIREGIRIAAAYALDRQEQYVASSGCFEAVNQVAAGIARGDAMAAHAHGELDDLFTWVDRVAHLDAEPK